MNMKLLIGGMLAAVLAVSCYKEEDVVAEIGEPLYAIEDSDDPIDHFRYEFLQKYGIYILYDYTELDYRWNLNGTDLLECRFVLQKDKEWLAQGIDFLQRVLLDDYDDDFKKKYLPVKILLADTIINNAYSGTADEVVFAGRNYLALGQIRESLKNLTPEELNERKGLIHGKLWASNIFANGLIDIPQEFFEPGSEYYEKSIGSTNDAAFDPRDFGFWSYKQSGSACMAPSQSADVGDFVRMITTHTETEMQELMAGFDMLKNKYDMLLNHLTRQYKIDLQAIGNKNTNN